MYISYSSLIDMMQEYNMDVNKHIIVIGSLPHGIKLCIEQEFPWSERHIASTTLVYTSHGQEKLSYHILFPTLVTSEPPMDIALYNLVTEGLDDRYCDRVVYRWWGQLRLLRSTKMTKVQRRRYKKIQGRDS